ncbi:MAG: ABC-F family ATP-binding cassette domain-containing protein [Syntrophomonadaceae bacterium]|nr:ABC-F family ATP-binding cassette domain-containing protein [Syntrophomonadaceae bacterium]
MLISCRDIKKSFADKVVLECVSIDISRGDKIGLVGRNGTGKSTLANILTGKLDYDRGSIITSRQHLKIGYLQQTESEAELQLSTLSDTDIKGDFKRLASHLGIKQLADWPGDRWQNLSGGEKTKLALAKVWALQADLLILDEPTNHMDYEGIKYLIAQIADYSGTLMVISHDRYFLDQTVSKIAELEKGLIKIYPGNYSSYRETKQKELESQQHLYASQQKEERKIEAAISQLKNWSDKAHRESRQKAGGMMGGKEYFRKKAKKRDRAVKSQIKRLEKMQQLAIERPDKEVQVNFNLDTMNKSGRRILTAANLAKSYGARFLFKDSSFYINRGEKIGILGPNGCGKTTLIKIILGEEDFNQGEIFISPSAKIAYVSQDLHEGENFSLTDLIKDRRLIEQKQVFELLIQLGLPFDRLSVDMGNLSRGERMKIDIGLAIMGKYDLLILDEPTNHLDLPSREALEESLKLFPGTIIIISHDRYLLNEVCEHLLVFDNHKIIRVEGKINDYLAKKNKRKDAGNSNKIETAEEMLLLETQISRVLGELSLLKADAPNYTALDQEYKRLIQRRKELKQ